MARDRRYNTMALVLGMEGITFLTSRSVIAMNKFKSAPTCEAG